MEGLSIKLTNYILRKKVIQKEDYDVYQYGFQSFLEILTNILCSIIIASLLNMLLECIVFFLIFIPIRSFNGGFHLQKYYACLLFSCMALTIVLLMVKYLVAPLHISFILYLISLLLIILIGPVDHPNRKVDFDENIFFKWKTNVTLFLSLILAIVLLLNNVKRYLFLEALVFVLLSGTIISGKIKYMSAYNKNR